MIDFQCGDNEGDCDNDNQCKEGLKCGSDNCDISLGFASTVDCCYSDVDFCKTENPFIYIMIKMLTFVIPHWKALK